MSGATVFDTIFNFPSRNVRAYFNRIGSSRAFSGLPPEREAIKHIREILEKGNFARYNFSIPFIWGIDADKIVDIYGLTYDGQSWVRDAGQELFTFRNGVPVKDLSLRTAMAPQEEAILRAEHAHRERCCDREHYAEEIPKEFKGDVIIQIGSPRL